MDTGAETPRVSSSTTARGTKGRIRVQALQAALGVAFLEAIPGGTDVARLVGIDPVARAKRRMLKDVGADSCHDSAGPSPSLRASPRAAKQATRVFVRVAKGALKGSRYAAFVAKRATLIVTVVSSVTLGIIAYRELTTVGFAVLGDA